MTTNRAGDIYFFYRDTTTVPPEQVDMRLVDGDLVREEGFHTQVLIALFSDGYSPEANDDDVFSNRRGFWGDMLLERPLGSKLWLLARAKLDETTEALWKQYVEEALQFMLDDGQAKSITVSTQRSGFILYWSVQIERPNDSVTYRFFRNWESMKYGELNG